MKSKDLAAFDLSKETDATREKYGLGCLLARRLIENNVRTVEVIRGGWDAHPALIDEPHLDLDRGLAALLDDLEERGLLEKTIVVVCTEFGRSPKIQNLFAGELVPQDPVEGRQNRKGVPDVGPWVRKYVRGFELGIAYHRHGPG